MTQHIEFLSSTHDHTNGIGQPSKNWARQLSSFSYGLAAIVLAVGSLLGCDKPDEEKLGATNEETTEEEQLEEQVENNPEIEQVQEIKDEPASFVGKTVTIAGEVDEVFGMGVLRVDGVTTLWGDEIYVLVDSEALPEQAIAEGGKLKITGEVQQVTVTEIEAEYEIDLETEIEAEVETYPVLVAEEVNVADVI